MESAVVCVKASAVVCGTGRTAAPWVNRYQDRFCRFAAKSEDVNGFSSDSSSAWRQSTCPMLPLSWNANSRGGMPRVVSTGSEWKKSVSGSILLCRSPLFSFVGFLSGSLLPVAPHLSPHCLSSYSFCLTVSPLSPGILFSVFDLGIPFLPKQTKQPQTSLNCNPQFAYTHMHTHAHSLLLITHRKWAPMQTRPAWRVEPRMEFQTLKRSPVEEIEHDLSPPSFHSP